VITIEVRDDLISAAVFGEFTLEDFKEFEDAVEYRNRFGGPVDVLFDLRNMLGFTIDAAWEEFRFARQHPSDFRRIAIIAEDDWLAMLTWLESLFLEAEIKVFDTEEEALAWIREGRDAPGHP
jgi:hypothetical protein